MADAMVSVAVATGMVKTGLDVATLGLEVASVVGLVDVASVVVAMDRVVVATVTVVVADDLVSPVLPVVGLGNEWSSALHPLPDMVVSA